MKIQFKLIHHYKSPYEYFLIIHTLIFVPPVYLKLNTFIYTQYRINLFEFPEVCDSCAVVSFFP